MEEPIEEEDTQIQKPKRKLNDKQKATVAINLQKEINIVIQELIFGIQVSHGLVLDAHMKKWEVYMRMLF